MKSKKQIFVLSIVFLAGILLNLIPKISYGTEINITNSFQRVNPIATLSRSENVVTQKKPDSQLDKDLIEDARIDNVERKYIVNPDYSYTQFMTQQTTLLTKQGIENGQRDFWDYSPDTEFVELIDAYVVQPNGEKIKVSSNSIFTRSSPEHVPGFNNNKRLTVVFPKLMVGSQTFVKWKFTQKKPSEIDFSSYDVPDFWLATLKRSVEIELPVSLKLNWKKRGNYTVTDTLTQNRRIIKAVITNQPSRRSESGMVSYLDFDSMFIFSNLENWSDIGKIAWDKWREKAIVTPEIQQLASQITGDKKGIEAARLLYNWVVQNIKYLSVALDESTGYVPHTSTEILRDGYGDCKDYVLLMHTLLKAKNIKSVPTFVNDGSIYQPLPLPSASFNHAIIYLPDYNLFADPTNIYSALDELDPSISNKFVVLATETGLTKYTPKSSPNKNGYDMKATIVIDNNGDINGQSELQYFGNFNSSYRRYFASDTPKQIANQILFATPEDGTGTLETSDLNNLDLPMKVRAKWNSPNAINIEKQIYLNTPVGISTISPESFKGYIRLEKRDYPFIAEAANYNWEYKINIPTAYKVIRLPENKDFSNTTGSYKSSYQQSNGYIQVKRNLVINNDVYSHSEYPAFQNLIRQPVRDVRSMMVLEKA
ncbi:hypothetical protein NIES4071_62230 [Calothrix sp. NIES-4071]|nr:hypothetical protein NIES4071_62230 [Calothrix sp. NIES-4071]BAZ60527.1 hypothetical protein NIES4105_62180 [Calothrix sp. NIES-4105]